MHAWTDDKKVFIHDNFVVIRLWDRLHPRLPGFTFSKIPLLNHLFDFASGNGGCPKIIRPGVFIIEGAFVCRIISSPSTQRGTLVVRGPGHFTTAKLSSHLRRIVHYVQVFSLCYVGHSDFAKWAAARHDLQTMGEIVESETQQESKSVRKSQQIGCDNERPSGKCRDPPMTFIAVEETAHANRDVVTNDRTKQALRPNGAPTCITKAIVENVDT
jgi:hypothetical protein